LYVSAKHATICVCVACVCVRVAVEGDAQAVDVSFLKPR
jgi:hypothetical protein